MIQTPPSAALQQATFSGGCFWCLHGPYDAQSGVSNIEVGYAGGSAEDATYEKVTSGGTKHRESIHMWYDPAVVSYEKLLEIFWRNIDPTDPGGQFIDRGYHYTTAISYHTAEQQRIAETSKQVLAASGKFSDPIATVIEPFVSFFPAEEIHQRYYRKQPMHYQIYKRGSGRSSYIKQTWPK